MSILCSATDAISSSSWYVPFKVLTLSVTICIVHPSNFCLGLSLSSEADFSNNGTRAPTSTDRNPCLPA